MRNKLGIAILKKHTPNYEKIIARYTLKMNPSNRHGWQKRALKRAKFKWRNVAKIMD